MGLNELVIRVLCIGSVLLYSASINLMAAPKIEVSDRVISQVLKLKENKTEKFAPVTIEEQFLFERLKQRIASLESLFDQVGSFKQLPILTIDIEHPLRYSVSSVDLIIGDKVLKSKGQIEKALIKSWLLQNASSALLVQPLKMEIFADLLLATYFGDLQIEDPISKDVATFSLQEDWSTDLFGTTLLCASAWRPADLISYCEGLLAGQTQPVNTPYGARKIIGSLIWSDIQKLGAVARLRTLSGLSKAAIEFNQTRDSLSNSQTLPALKASIETDAKSIYPELASELGELSEVAVVERSSVSQLVSGYEVTNDQAQFSKVVIESCATPTVGELLRRSSEKTSHILLVENCENRSIDYTGIAEGIPSFAAKNPQVKFVYLHRASLKLADKMIINFSIDSAIAYAPNSKDAKFLGMDQKTYRPDLKAFRVNGPIGAIEWYRSKTSSAGGSRS